MMLRLIERYIAPNPTPCVVSENLSEQFATQFYRLKTWPRSQREANAVMHVAVLCVQEFGSIETGRKYLHLPTHEGRYDIYYTPRRRSQTFQIIEPTGELEYELQRQANSLHPPVPIRLICKKASQPNQKPLWTEHYL
jgi:hypothetical protein